MTRPADNLFPDFARERDNAQKENVCTYCQQSIVLVTELPKKAGEIYTDAGAREYKITGMCEYCWDLLFKEEDGDDY